jgi:hypothetical protein
MKCQSCGGRTELTGQVYLPDGRVVCQPCAVPRPAAAQQKTGTSTRDLVLIAIAVVIGVGGAAFALNYERGPSKDPNVIAARQEVEVTMYFTHW